jgi:hypothetical protein
MTTSSIERSERFPSVLESRRGVILILLLSLIARWVLVLRGGQYYFSDEGRYETSRTFVNLAASGKFNEAVSQLFIAPEHLGFKIIGILPALAEKITRESYALPALFFSLFSVLNLYLIYLISRRVGASTKESLYALILAASSMSLIYFSRHVMPYDAAMTFGLLAFHVALADKPDFKASLACGTLGFLCFITYNGYWPLAALAMLLHVLRGDTRFSDSMKKGFVASLGFILPAVLLFIVAAISGVDLLREYLVFAGTVSQGSFDEGWSLPFEYLWHTEHLVIIATASLAIYALAASNGKNKSLFLYAVAILFIYLCLAIPSVFLQSFVVYGRLARQILPFLMLLGAAGLISLEGSFQGGRRLAQLLLVIVLLQAGWNYFESYRLSYPREFAVQAQVLYSDFSFSEKRLIFGAPALCQNNGYIAEYVKRFDLPPDANSPIVGQILLAAPHPDNFRPYQYEGYTYEQRQYLRALKPEMRLYKAANDFMSGTNPLWTTMKHCWVNENQP